MHLLFSSRNYYAQGGAHDMRGVFDSLDSATAAGRALFGTRLVQEGEWSIDDHEWWHVYGVAEGRIVAGTRSQAHGAPDIDGDTPT